MNLLGNTVFALDGCKRYNGQAVVDDKHQFIVAAQAFGRGQDSSLLKPMLEETCV